MHNKFNILGSSVYIDIHHSIIVDLVNLNNPSIHRLRVEVMVYEDDFKKNEYRLPILLDVIRKYIKENYPIVDRTKYNVSNYRGEPINTFFDINDFKQTIFQNISIGV